MDRMALPPVAMAAILGVPALAFFVHATTRPSPPRARVEPTRQRLVATPLEPVPRASFVVHNEGGRPLVLGDASTSCGCTVVAIEPDRILPGQVGRVVVEGTPPSAGERAVQVRVATNDRATPELILEVTLVGTRDVPLVASSTTAVNFGPVRSLPAEVDVRIETRERAGTPPWINHVSSSLPAVEVTGGLVEEIDSGQAAVLIRSYQYHVTLRAIPPIAEDGSFAGVLRLGSGESGPAVLSIPILGYSRRSISAAPSALYASLRSGEEPPRFRVMLVADDPANPVEADFAGDEEGLFEVTSSGRKAGMSLYDVRFTRLPERGKRLAIRFTTSDPNSPVVTVPVVVHWGDD
jgi:hypothetical protein